MALAVDDGLPMPHRMDLKPGGRRLDNAAPDARFKVMKSVVVTGRKASLRVKLILGS